MYKWTDKVIRNSGLTPVRLDRIPLFGVLYDKSALRRGREEGKEERKT